MYIYIYTYTYIGAVSLLSQDFLAATQSKATLQVILSLGCSVISVAFYYLRGYFSLLMPYWL
jgi:hypothetical protein